MGATVVVLKTTPETVLDDYRKLMHLAEYEGFIDRTKDTILKLNLSWTKYFPATFSLKIKQFPWVSHNENCWPWTNRGLAVP